MTTTMAREPDLPADVESGPITLIPLTELTGTRAQKLAQLDDLLSSLHDLRSALVGHAGGDAARHQSNRNEGARVWWYAGFAAVWLLSLFALWQWLVQP